MADLKITGEVVVSAENAEATFERLADKADQMADQIKGAAKGADDQLKKIPESLVPTTEKFTRAESRISDSIKRTQRSIEQLGKTASQKLELRIEEKGLDPAKFEPLLKKLREAEAAQLALAKASTIAGTQGAASLDKIGISAKQTAAALRGVPAQFTDIVTSLQGGQAPLTVFLQQGGQLKDMFGGAGNAARALGGYMLGLVNPFTVAAAAAVGFAFVTSKGQQEQSEYAKAIILSGNAVGVTTGQLKSYAQAISAVAGTQGNAAAALGEFVQFGKVGAENLQAFTLAAINFEKATGAAITDTVKQFAELAKAPVEASIKLNEQINFLTVDLFKQIKALEDQGKATEAAALAQKSFADVISSRSGQILENIGSFERAWRAVKKAISEAGDAVLNVGRTPGLQEQLKKATADVDRGKQPFNPSAFGGNAEFRARLPENLALEASLKEQIKLLQRGADIESSRATQAKAGVEFIQQGNKFLTDKQKLEKEIVQTRNLGIAAGLTEKVIQERIAEIREKSNKGGSKSGLASGGENEVASINARTKAQREYFALLQDKGKLADDLTEGQKLSIKIQEQLKTSITGVARALKERALVAAQELASVDLLIQAEKRRVEAQKEAMKVAVAVQQVRQKESDAIEDYMRAQEQAQIATVKAANDSVAAAQAEFDSYGKTKSQIAEVTLARLNDKLAAVNAGSDIAKSLEAQITAQKQIIGILSSGEARDISEKAAKDAADDWKKTAESIQTSLTDALLRGFESGKGFGKNLIDTLKNMFRTLVLRPTISAIVNPVAGAITSSLGMAGAANAATGGGAGGLLSSVGSLTSGAGILGAGGLGLQAGFGALMNGGFAGITAAVQGGFAAIASGTGAGIAAGLGTVAGALGPIALGAVALYSLFGNKLSASKSTGSLERTYNAAGAVTSERSPFAIGNGAQMIDGLYARFNGLQELLQAKGGASFAYGAYSGTGDKNPMGRISGGGFNSGEIPTAELGLAASRAILSALQASEMPAGIAKIINSIDPAKASAEQIEALQANAVAYVQTIKALGASFDSLPFANLKGMAFETADALVTASGGMESFSNSLKSYYDNFYSAEEKRVQTITEITSKLNAAGAGLTTDQVGGMNRSDFRAKFEAAGNSPELNAALLSVAGAFASITPEATAAVASITAVSTAISDTMKGLQKDSLSLGADVLEASGKTGEAEAARRLIATAGYTQLEIAAYDFNAALREEIKTRNAATEAIKAAVTAQTSLVQKYTAPINEASAKDLLGPNFFASIAGKSAEKIREMASAYASGLDSQTVAGRAAIASFEKLTPAIDFFVTASETAAQKITDQRTGLQDRLNAATDNTAQAADRAREAIDPLNRTLYGLVTAAEAAKAAAETQKSVVQKYAAPITATSAAAALGPDVFAAIVGKSADQIREMARVYAASLDSQTVAGRAAIANLDKFTPAIDFFASAADGGAQAFVTASQKIIDQRVSLEQQLFDLTATDTQKATKSREAIDPENLDVYDKVVVAQRAAKDATDKVTRATELATRAAAEYAAQMSRFGGSFNLRFDLTKASTALLVSVSTALGSVLAGAVASVARSKTLTDPANSTNPDDYRPGGVTARHLVLSDTSNVLTATNNALVQAQRLRGFFTGLASEAVKLEKEISDANTAIGKGVQAINVAKYFTDFATDLSTAFSTIKAVFDTGTATLAGAQGVLDLTAGGTAINVDRSTTRIQEFLTSIGANLTEFGTYGLETLVNSVGGGAGKIGAAITTNLLASISSGIKDNAAFKDLSTSSLAYVSAVVGGVSKGDVQGINDAFVLLSGALGSGKINATQYDTAITLVTTAFSVGADAAGTAAESVADAYKRLNEAIKSNEQIAQERISLEGRLNTATDTTAQALARARAAIDPYNRTLFDSVTAAEAAKTAQLEAAEATKAIASERKTLQDQLNGLTDTSTQALTRQRDALDSSNRALFDQVQTQIKANATAAERNTLQDQLNSLTDTAAQALTRQRDALDSTNKALFDQVQAATAAKNIAQERGSLEDRLNAATDTTAEALARVRAAIDPLNRALFDSVIAAEAAKNAQVESPAAAQSVAAAERKTLQDQLNSLTDTAAQSLTRQRDALDESNRALFDQIQAQTKVNATAAERKGLQDQINSLSDTSAQALTRQRDALDSSNRALFDQVQALTAAKAIMEERRGLQEQYDQLTLSSTQLLAQQRGALDGSNRALFDSIQLVKAEATAKETAAKGAADAMSALQRAVGAQRSIVQVARDAAAESVSEITSVFDILKSSVKELYGTVESTAKMQADDGRAFIKQALATAQSTGYLPESKALADAINAAKGGNQEFASQFEKDFSALTLAGDLSQIEALSKGRLTEAQQALQVQNAQLTALDGVLSLAQQQLDASNGINTSVLSVSAALAGFADALKAQATANEPRAFSNVSGSAGGTTERLESLVEGLTKEVQRLQTIVNDGNVHQRRTADTLENVTEGGANMRTVAT